MPKLIAVLASANPHKAIEIAEIIGAGIELRPRPADVPDVVEDGATLEENARLKAVALVAATGYPALADDTGLEVDALGGRPGVHSARYAGEAGDAEANMAKLLHELAGLPMTQRTARFRTVALLRFPDGRELVSHGVVEGRIIDAPRGGAGFGYDPIFEPAESGGLTFAEMSSAAKNAISHRGRAFRSLATLLK